MVRWNSRDCPTASKVGTTIFDKLDGLVLVRAASWLQLRRHMMVLVVVCIATHARASQSHRAILFNCGA